MCATHPTSPVFAQAAPFFDKLVFRKVAAGLGGRLQAIISGGASLAPHVEKFLRVTMCCPVVQVGRVGRVTDGWVERVTDGR